MSILDKSTNHQHSGLSKDLAFESSNDLTFALNMIKDGHDGSLPLYQSEPGNSSSFTVPTGHRIIGTIYGKDNEVLVFTTNNLTDTIGLYRDGKYTQLVSAVFGFSMEYPITGEYRVKNGCDSIWYWCDHLNPDRWFNTDQQDLFKTAGIFDVNKFSFNPDVQVPNISLVSVNDAGGNLPVGSYYFQVEILDSNFNTIHKSDISPQVVIYSDSVNLPYAKIKGNVNFPQFDQLAGGIPPTNKSITLQFSNLSLDNSFLRISVAYQISANQVLLAHQVANLIPITNTTIQYTYTKYDPSIGDSPIDFTSMLIPLVSYESSYVMEQVQNRLVRANIKGTNRDYSDFQTITETAQLRWVASDSLYTNNEIGTASNPLTYWDKTTFQGDEAYCMGLQYLHDNGEWSPVFHKSGRASVSNDTQLLTVIADNLTPTSTQVWLSDVEHLPQSYFTTWAGVYLGSTIQRWKVFNTASIITSQTITRPFTYEGDFGYFETDEIYPDLRDCENVSIYGALTNQKVRHHRFPDRRLVSHLDGNYIVPYGIKCTLSSLPPGTIGYRVVYRNLETVKEVGYLNTRREISNEVLLTGFHGSTSSTTKYASMTSIDSQYNSSVPTGSFVKQNRVFKFTTNSITSLGSTFSIPSSNSNLIRNAIIYTNGSTSSVPLRNNYKIDKQVIIDAGKTLDSVVTGITVKNRDYWTNYGLVKITNDFENYSTFNGGQDTSFLLNILDPRLIDDGNSVYTYKKVLPSVPNLYSLTYSASTLNPSTGTIISYGGDRLITRHRTVRLANTNILLNQQEAPENVWETIVNEHQWVESQYNSNLRYRGISQEFRFFETGEDDITFIKKFVTIIERSANDVIGEIKTTDTWIEEFYRLNRDYTLQKIQQPKISLGRDYDYCSKCLNYYPNRIIFSPNSFSEETEDKYRVNLSSDYIEIPAHRGEITGIKFRNNSLLVHCEDTTFILQPNPQTIGTDQSQAYLTTGDFLSIPPVEFNQSDVGFAGCQSKQAQNTNEYLHVWVDEKRGQVFGFDNQIKVLDIGLTQWLKEYLPSKLKEQLWNVYNIKPSFKSTIPDWGYGVHVYYDPKFKRVIISKRDRQAISAISNPGRTGMYFNQATNKWEYYVGVALITDNVVSSDPKFINYDWTLSYDLKFNRYISWHSYIPYGAFSDNQFYYTFNNNISWKHLHLNNFQRYYNTKYDAIVEVQTFDVQTDRLTSVHYQGYTFSWDSIEQQWVEQQETFNKFICYNHNQSTGLQNLVLQDGNVNPYINTSLTGDTKYVVKTDQNYKISGIYDMSTGQPVMTKSWPTLSAYGSYIDQVPININFNKSQYEWAELSDKYVNTKLFFKPVTDSKILFILNQIQEQISIR